MLITTDLRVRVDLHHFLVLLAVDCDDRFLEVMMSSTEKRVTKASVLVFIYLFIPNCCGLVGTCHGWLTSQQQEN